MTQNATAPKRRGRPPKSPKPPENTPEPKPVKKVEPPKKAEPTVKPLQKRVMVVTTAPCSKCGCPVPTDIGRYLAGYGELECYFCQKNEGVVYLPGEVVTALIENGIDINRLYGVGEPTDNYKPEEEPEENTDSEFDEAFEATPEENAEPEAETEPVEEDDDDFGENVEEDDGEPEYTDDGEDNDW